MKTILLILLRLALLLLPYFLRAQEPLDIAREYVRTHLGEWDLTPQDADGMTVNDVYTDKISGITRVYFLQRHRGIPVYNAILNVNITKEGKVFFAGNRFVPGLSEKVNTTQTVLSAGEAVTKLAAHLGLPAEELRLKKQSGETEFVFEKGKIAKEDITVTLIYQPCGEKVLLAWDILFSPAGTFDKWSTRVDAISGTVLNEYNWTVYCQAGGSSFSGEHDNNERPLQNPESLAPVSPQPDAVNTGFDPALTGAQYKVWPAPIEGPGYGPRILVTDPADLQASPYGWHDTNGLPGPEFTRTRGNNAWAYQDRNNSGLSSNDEPDGGASLHFDFPYDPSWEPEQYVDASVVNLFYWANFMHDFAYRFGFDEVAGNFQKNNYGNGGMGNDFMYVVAQAGANAGFANNPSYTHGNEGSTGTVFATEFIRLPRCLTVNEPAVASGALITSLLDVGWGDGSYVDEVPVTGEVVLVNDGVEEPSFSDGCEEIINTAELAGKIALIDRGSCEIGLKALQAQNAGAIGVIICNYNSQYIWKILPGQYGADVHIPVVFIRATDGQAIRQYAGNGLKVTLVNPGQSGPAAFDLGFDNCIIAHEYGHGITWRLAGGPNAACLDNHENTDEGWSDFFALAVTARPGDTGAKKRGLGAYFYDEPSTGSGHRRYPYSTDMSINPLTYSDISNSESLHDLGEVWASVLWDMYWALADKYGWSADLSDESSGNHKAIRLAFDGLKNLPCSPGFVDGRNAILAADEALYNGENTCLIWEVFARRGLGYSANQGSPFHAGDQKAGFDVLPACANQLLIEKSVTGFIQPGDDIQVTIKVGNFKQVTATNVIVTDEIPAGTTFKPNSSNLPANLLGNSVSFHLGDMDFMEEKSITYTLESAPDGWSQRNFLDNVPNENGANWLVYTLGNEALNDWSITSEFPAHSGSFCWHSKDILGGSRQALELNPDIYSFHVEGNRPVLRFYHRYDIREILNGGIVEIKEVGASVWEQVDNDMIRNGYPCFLHYQTFFAPNLHGFSGNSGSNFEASYVDLSKWTGKNIHIRFRFGTSEVTGGDPGLGWLIDDIEFMDMLAYNGEACVRSDQGDLECTTAPEAGTIVDSRAEPLGTTEQENALAVKIYPNPATDVITVEMATSQTRNLTVSLFAADGRQLLVRSLRLSGDDCLKIDTAHTPAGLYFLKVSSDNDQIVRKVVIQKKV